MTHQFSQAGAILKAARKACCLRQSTVATCLGVSKRVVKYWESGFCRPKKHAVLLLVFLELSIQDLIAVKRIWCGLPQYRTKQERQRDGITVPPAISIPRDSEGIRL